MNSGPAPLLAIDTSTNVGSVAVGRGHDLLAEVIMGVQARQSEALLPAIDFVLRSADLTVRGIGGVVVGGGPGSFTGVRIAASTAKGLVRALDVPLLAYSGLMALAAQVGAGDAPVCGLFDARRGEVYAACYRFPDDGEPETLLAPTACPIGEVVEELAGQRPIYVGDGALRYADVIRAHGDRIAPAYLAVPRAAGLLWLADRAPDQGAVDSPAAWEPAYLREAGAERGVRG